MEALRSKKDTKFAMEQTVACMVMGGMSNGLIMQSVEKIFNLTPLETLRVMDLIQADRLMMLLFEDRLELEDGSSLEL